MSSHGLAWAWALALPQGQREETSKPKTHFDFIALIQWDEFTEMSEFRRKESEVVEMGFSLRYIEFQLPKRHISRNVK